MSQNINYYFDDFGVYADSCPALTEAAAPPDNALWVAPPDGCPEGYAVVAKADRSGWEIVPDYRAAGAFDPTGQWRRVDRPGELPDGWSAEPPPPAPEDLQQQFVNAIQFHLDEFARTRNYDGILSAATYATSTVPKFQAEGQYAVEARDATWAKGYEILAEVTAGLRPLPTVEDVLTELPVLAWPD